MVLYLLDRYRAHVGGPRLGGGRTTIANSTIVNIYCKFSGTMGDNVWGCLSGCVLGLENATATV